MAKIFLCVSVRICWWVLCRSYCKLPLFTVLWSM